MLWITAVEPPSTYLATANRVLLAITVGDVANEYESQTGQIWAVLSDDAKDLIIAHAARHIEYFMAHADFSALLPEGV